MNSSEKLAALFAGMDVWEEISVHILRKPFALVEAKKTFVMEAAIKQLAPNWTEEQVYTFFIEYKEEGIKEYLRDLLQRKHDLDKMMKSFKENDPLKFLKDKYGL